VNCYRCDAKTSGTHWFEPCVEDLLRYPKLDKRRYYACSLNCMLVTIRQLRKVEEI